ncbi:MAG: transcriptional repressor [Erythrobacter sp.]|uniref:Fur family transcriptional regulator n=1 Tax=Erythrobacter sp. TaxID=1042 RepID=UPI002606A6AF|nr:transcriptional repressor [Erythrobacter sp.]MDJ0979588.1 transcriptional repressor [Erythrobacter sp.]
MSECEPHALKELSGDELVAAARSVLIRSGEQWTTMREAVFVELARFERPISAYDVADRLSEIRGKRVAPNSIYRILDVFVANGLAVRIESSNAYIVNSHPGHSHDCIFLVCEECGDAAHVDDPDVSRSVRALVGRRQFHTDHLVLEMRGLCRQCA